MGKVTSSTLSDELSLLRQSPDNKGLKRFFSSLMTMEKSRQMRVINEAISFARDNAEKDPAIHWMKRLNREYPGDIGILSPIFLNLVRLEPGEAVYLPAGELHAYFEGVGVELMANSDNVLRGGLTGKHIDVTELLRVTRFETESVRKVQPVSRSACETVYPTPASEFLLSMISVDKDEAYVSPYDRNVEILICVQGKIDINDLGNGEILTLTKGKSVVVPSAVLQYRIDGTATIYRASVP
jgi:mannose-6-phosphate isomerase